MSRANWYQYNDNKSSTEITALDNILHMYSRHISANKYSFSLISNNFIHRVFSDIDNSFYYSENRQRLQEFFNAS